MIPQDEWLHEAKKAPLGGAVRVYHGAERRPNMTVYNAGDRWSCWCHACHEGGVVLKEFVQLTAPVSELRSGQGMPEDAVPLAEAREYEQALCLEHIVRRGIDPFMHLGGVRLMYTHKYNRLLLEQRGGSFCARALGPSKVKALTYSVGPAPLLALHPDDSLTPGADVVLTEDYLSALKARIALGPAYTVISQQGTGLAKAARAQLLQARSATIMLDGDTPGYEATPVVARALSALGVKVRTVRTPAGCDPKNLTHEHIRELVAGAISNDRQ